MGKVSHFREKDQAYSWLVMVAAFFCNMINAGQFTAPALLLVEWYTVFSDKSTAVIAWLPAVGILTRSFAGIFVGGLIKTFGSKTVMMVASVGASMALFICSFSKQFELLVSAFAIHGFFIGLTSTVPMAIVYEYFEKYKSLASGLSLCGHSLSSFFMVALYRYCIDTYGWRGAMLIMAGMALNGCVGAMLFVPNVEQEKSSRTGCKLLQCTELCNINFLLFALGNMLHTTQISVIYLLTTSRAVSKGLTEMQGSMLIPFIGLASTCARFVTSWISNMKCTSHIALYTVSVFILSVTIAVSCIKPEDVYYNAASMALCGLMVGSSMTVAPACLVRLVGQENLAGALGVASAINGPANTLILPFAGLVYDLTGDFNNSFFLGSVFGLAGGLLCLVVVVRLHCCSGDIKSHDKSTEEATKSRDSIDANSESCDVNYAEAKSCDSNHGNTFTTSCNGEQQVVVNNIFGSQVIYASTTSLNANHEKGFKSYI